MKLGYKRLTLQAQLIPYISCASRVISIIAEHVDKKYETFIYKCLKCGKTHVKKRYPDFEKPYGN